MSHANQPHDRNILEPHLVHLLLPEQLALMRTPHPNAYQELKKARGRLAKALHYQNGTGIQVYKTELFQLLWQAGEDVDMERDTSSDLVEVADTILKELKYHG